MSNKGAEAVWRFYQKLMHNPDKQLVQDFLPVSDLQTDLPDQNSDFAESTKRQLVWSNRYRQKGISWCRFMRFLPFVRAVALCNSVALGTADKNSDIDLLIITAPKKLWTARVFVTGFCQIFGIRRHGNKIAGRLCLSFFCTTDALDFSQIALKPKDPYLAFWVSSLVPVFGTAIFEKIADQNREFVSRHGIGIRFEKSRKQMTSGESKFRRFTEFFIPDIAENLLKKKLLPRAERKQKQLDDDSGIILSENILKFHNRDRRQEFLSD